MTALQSLKTERLLVIGLNLRNVRLALDLAVTLFEQAEIRHAADEQMWKGDLAAIRRNRLAINK